MTNLNLHSEVGESGNVSVKFMFKPVIDGKKVT